MFTIKHFLQLTTEQYKCKFQFIHVVPSCPVHNIIDRVFIKYSLCCPEVTRDQCLLPLLMEQEAHRERRHPPRLSKECETVSPGVQSSPKCSRMFLVSYRSHNIMEYVYYIGVGLPLSNDNYEYKVWNNISYRWLSARLQRIQCVSNGVTTVLHWAIDVYC